MSRASSPSPRRSRSSTTTRKSSGSPPPPTPSEAAFERALASLRGDPSTPALRASARDDNGVRAFVDAEFARREEYARDTYSTIADAPSFHSKIAGVSFEGRQDTIAGLREGVALELVREPEHEKDANAIAVFYGDLRLGYVKAAIAKHIAPLIDNGARYRARIENLTGVLRQAQDDKWKAQGDVRYRGVNIFVERDAAAAAEERSHERERLRETWGGEADSIRVALIGDGRPHAFQDAVLERIEHGRNALALFGTGRGKSFCFQYPAVLRALAGGGKTLAIYPLRALANDQYEAMQRRLEQFGLRILRANGSIDAAEREDLFTALRDGSWDVVLSTPEFLSFHREAFAGPSAPSFVVVDEAHHIFDSRHRDAYARLGATIASLGSPQVLALTATAGADAFARIVDQLHIDAWVIDPTVRENLHLVDARGTRDKVAYLRDVFEDGGKAIVYCNSRNEAGKVAERLRAALARRGGEVMFYHAGMPSAARRDVEGYFRDGALRVVVATSAFGEGIDLPDVRHVALYHLNFDFTEFNQQAGRAGRDGEPASVHLLYGESDKRINEFIIDRGAPTLPLLRRIYAGMKGMARDGILHGSLAEMSRTLDLEKADDRTLRAAVAIFEDEGLVESAVDDDGRYVRFLTPPLRVDMTRNERFAEGEAERESFARFADFALTASVEDLERLVNRPIYPNVELRR